VFFAARRRSRRRQPQYQTRLPDWVWGAGLGAIVVIFVAAFFLFSRLSGSGSTCDDPLNPLPGAATHPNDASGFAQEDEDLGRLVSALQQGDVNAANTIFFGPAHNFMHTAEPEIRAKDEELGKKLCEAVIEFETNFDSASRTNPAQLAAQVQQIREYLRDGAEVLGFPRRGG
jgi:hypothetical protein